MSFTASLNEIVERNENGPLAKHASWCRVPLSFVATVLNGYPFASENFTRSDGMPLLRIRDVRQRETEAFYKGEYDPTYLVEPNELVVGMDGDFHCALWKGPVALLNQRVCKITVNEEFYGRKLLSFVLPGYLNAINAATSSVTVKHLSSRTVAEIPLPLPPVKEQRRIVSEIEKQFTRLDAAIEALKRVRANLKRYRASVLQAACGGRLVPTEAELARADGHDYEPADKLLARILKERRARWEADQLAKMHAAAKPPKNDKWKAKYIEPVAPDIGSLPDVPAGWVWASVECIGVQGEQSVLTGPFGTNMGKTDFADSGVPVLTIGCLTRGGIKPDKAVFISEQKAIELERYRLRTGDMLFSRMATVGRAGVVTDSLDGALFNYHLMRLRLSPAAILPEFFMAYVRGSEALGAYVRDVNHGATRPGINTDQLLRMPIVLPPLAEQHRIVAEVERRLSVIDELDAVIDANLKRADRLRQAILKRVFEGKLVPQDPSDEPASVLLERIKAAKSGSTATPGCGTQPSTGKSACATTTKETSGRRFRQMDAELDRGASGPLWLRDPEIAGYVEDAILRGEKLRHYQLDTYVVMPNHVHVLLWPWIPMARITGGIKGVSARDANAALGRVGKHFWEDESFDHWVRDEAELMRIRSYIERNPVSAGLVQRPEDWPWSSAARRRIQPTGKSACATITQPTGKTAGPIGPIGSTATPGCGTQPTTGKSACATSRIYCTLSK